MVFADKYSITLFPYKQRLCDYENTFLYLMNYGGPDGELAASLRYLSQRYSMPNEIARATLNDIGTEVSI